MTDIATELSGAKFGAFYAFGCAARGVCPLGTSPQHRNLCAHLRTPGYGTSVIEDLIPYELSGTVDLRFTEEGVHCKIAIPTKWIGGDA